MVWFTGAVVMNKQLTILKESDIEPKGYSQFASARRVGRAEILEQRANLLAHRERFALLDCIPQMVLIVNQHRQIVHCNQAVQQVLRGEALTSLLGLRPGEFVGCSHADENPGGCGTSQYCSVCGCVIAILESLKGRSVTRVCRIARSAQMGPMTLRVTASPLDIAAQRYSLVYIEDISESMRTQELEWMLADKVMPMISTIEDLLTLAYSVPANFQLLLSEGGAVNRMLDRLDDELKERQTVSLVERGVFKKYVTDVPVMPLLEEIKEVVVSLGDLGNAGEQPVVIVNCDPSIAITTDRSLLKIAIRQILENAVEARQVGEAGQARVSVYRTSQNGSMVRIEVVGGAYMTPQIQMQVFQRSFSTKSKGRGLGCYHARLLVEEYLGGTIYFQSTQDDGTIFWIDIPAELTAPAGA